MDDSLDWLDLLVLIDDMTWSTLIRGRTFLISETILSSTYDVISATIQDNLACVTVRRDTDAKSSGTASFRRLNIVGKTRSLLFHPPPLRARNFGHSTDWGTHPSVAYVNERTLRTGECLVRSSTDTD